MPQKTPWLNLTGRKRLIEWRRLKRLEAQDVAAMIPVAPETYSRIEAGIRRPPEDMRTTIEKITKGKVKAYMWSKSWLETSV